MTPSGLPFTLVTTFLRIFKALIIILFSIAIRTDMLIDTIKNLPMASYIVLVPVEEEMPTNSV